MDFKRMLRAIEEHNERSSDIDSGLGLMVHGAGLMHGLVDILTSDAPDQEKIRKDLMDARIALGLAASKLENTEMLDYVQRYLQLVAELTVLAA